MCFILIPNWFLSMKAFKDWYLESVPLIITRVRGIDFIMKYSNETLSILDSQGR